MEPDIQMINGKWTLILGDVKITASTKEALESLLKSFTDEAE